MHRTQRLVQGDRIVLGKISEGRQEAECIPRECSVCKEKIGLEVGDVIYGDEWYHSECWDGTVKTILNSRDQ